MANLRGRHGEYDYLSPGARQGYDWSRYIDLVGHKEEQLLDQSKRSYRTKWLDPHARENKGFWGNNFTLHRYNFSEYSPGDRQYFTGNLRRKWEEDAPELRYQGWKHAGTEHEILDWDAYNRDVLYANALQQRHSRRDFQTLQDIWDAEDVMSGRWSKPAPPPPPAPKPSPTPQPLNIKEQLERIGITPEKPVGGWQEIAQDWDRKGPADRNRYGERIGFDGPGTMDFIDSDGDGVDDRYQEGPGKPYKNELEDLRSQLNADFTERFSKQQKDLTSKYEGLLSQARTDAEAARVKQAQEFEQRRLDQEAGWQAQEQAWNKKDSVYQSQLGELKSSLGVQRDLYSGLQGRFGDLQGELGEQKGLYSGLQGQYSGLQDQYSGLQGQFGQAREDWSRQAQGYQREIGDVKTSLAESQRQAAQLGEAVKRNEEQVALNAERARVAASYGSQGKPLNQPVKGVRTLNELTPTKKRYTGARGTFGRSGAALRISNLNI